HVLSTRQADNGLWWGTVEFMHEDQDCDCPAEFDMLKEVAAALLEQAGSPWSERSVDYDSARWLSARLTEWLPFDAATKHTLLATDDPLERLRQIQPFVCIENRARAEFMRPGKAREPPDSGVTLPPQPACAVQIFESCRSRSSAVPRTRLSSGI